jgi:hypothetical protein
VPKNNNPAYQNVALQLKMQKANDNRNFRKLFGLLNKSKVTNQEEQSAANAEASTIPKDKILGNLNSNPL